MASDRPLDRLLSRMVDGEPIDWDRLPTVEFEEHDRAYLDALRVIDEVANAHRAVPDPDVTGGGGAPSQPSRRWGKYFLTERLGAGSFGEVYRAWDPSLRRYVAIKLLHAGLPGGGSISGRLLEEGQRLARVRHPNIVSVLEVEQHEGRHALCMEFVRGRTLDEVVRLEGTLSVPEAAGVGRAVCGALQAVHDAGLIHRDVKHNNVMREDAGRIVLMDFGSGSGVRPLVNAGHAERIVGTPSYMAPELLAGKPATPATDLYSVGVLLYFLVAGRHPVEGGDANAVIRAHQTGTSRPLADACPQLPRGFVEVVNKALSPNPHKRYRTAQALAGDLERVSQALKQRNTLTRFLTRAVASFLAGFLVLLFLGYLTSVDYHFLLGISGQFEDEGWLDYLTWGVRSLVAPLAMAVGVTGVLYLGLESVALLEKISTRFHHAMQQARSRLHRSSFAHQIELRDWARLAVVASVGFLVWVPSIGFPDLFQAFTGAPLVTAPDAALGLLGPPGMAEQDAYRQGLSIAATLMCAAWMTLWRAARQRGVSLGPAGWLGLVCVLASVALMGIPYRIMHHNQAEHARYERTDCYITGRTEEAFLLFCPSRMPRVLSVNRGDPALVLQGTFGSVFETVK